MADLELGNAVAEYQESLTNEQRIASLKKISSQVKHKALAESTAISIITLVTEAFIYGPEVRDAALSLLAYLVRRIHSQGQLASSKIAVALNTIPNWPDVLNALRKRGVPADVRNELQMALERPPSAGSGHVRSTAPERKPAVGTSTSRPNSSSSAGGKNALAKSVPALPADNGLEPIYVSSASNLDQICHDMLADFEGRENEDNWPRREKHILKLRQITKGNAVEDFTNAYIANWKLLLDGIIKCATSLRTTFSTGACLFIQEAAAAVGHGLDTYAGRLLEISVKMCGDTKPIAAQNGNSNVLALIRNVSWSKNMMSYISDACQDKNVRPREFAYGWIKAALEVHGSRKGLLEQGSGLDTLDKSFRRGIGDQNPKVRETAKKVFWDFHEVWPARANALLTSLDERTQKSINVLNSSGSSQSSLSVAPSGAVASAKAKAITSRPSIKDIMAAKRREKEKMVQRPQSALASLQSTERTTAKKPLTSTSRTAAEPTSTGGGLSSAPVRPGRKVIARTASRPEMSTHIDTDRPKTPFRSGAPRRPESRADEKRVDGPRRLGAPITKAPTTASFPPVKKTPAPSSLPASPEKVLTSPVSRRPKSITEDSPMTFKSQDLPLRPRVASTSSPPDHRLRSPESPLAAHHHSRLPTPARVYEDPRSSPSTSPQSVRARTPVLAPRHITSPTAHKIAGSGARGPVAGEGSLIVGESLSPVKMPLMELSTNEVNAPAQSGTTDPRYAKLIDSGIVHMKSGRLDPHGYRKLHAVITEQINTLTPEKTNELLTTIIHAPPGQENASSQHPTISSERIVVQRLHLLSAMGKSPYIQAHMANVLLALIHICRHETQHNGHTYWIAEGQMREFAGQIATHPNEAARGVLAASRDVLHATVLRCLTILVENKAFDKDDGELVSITAEVAGQAVALDKDVDARIQGHQLAKALGMDTIKKFLGEDQGGVAFMLYQSMKDEA